MKHRSEIAKFIDRGDFQQTDEGLLIHGAIMAKGKYYHTVNGADLKVTSNLVVAEGILYVLNAALGGAAQTSNWFLAPYSGNATPASNWTAANFATNATEITSATQGYSEANRQPWVSSAAADGKIGNLSSYAQFSIVASSPLNIYGAGLLSSQTKGGTSGTLVSATRFEPARQVNNGDTFELGYEVELTDS